MWTTFLRRGSGFIHNRHSRQPSAACRQRPVGHRWRPRVDLVRPLIGHVSTETFSRDMDSTMTSFRSVSKKRWAAGQSKEETKRKSPGMQGNMQRPIILRAHLTIMSIDERKRRRAPNPTTRLYLLGGHWLQLPSLAGGAGMAPAGGSLRRLL